MSIIALITDFGTEDHFVGSMKGAILGVYPRATLVDITHAITPGDARAAAFSLLLSYSDFPPKTIFAVVVDPGVGGRRKALAVKSGPYYFVGPDNGVLSLACGKAGKPVVRSLENTRYFKKPTSTTFHGRDIFGPVAAYLGKGVAFAKFGPITGTMISYKTPRVVTENNRIHGEIMHIDRFGNCVTSIEPLHLAGYNFERLQVKFINRPPFPVCLRYCDAPKGKAMGIIGSAGFLEISINRGNAGKKLKARIGDPIEVFCPSVQAR